jgi:hypothetical protein
VGLEVLTPVVMQFSLLGYNAKLSDVSGQIIRQALNQHEVDSKQALPDSDMFLRNVG